MYEQPPHSGPETSREAAEAITADCSRLQRAVLAFLQLRSDYGATRQEIEQCLNLTGNTVRPRIKELEAKGLIEVTEATRLTSSGRRANVIKAIQQAATTAPTQLPLWNG